jgi:hypothetical protein
MEDEYANLRPVADLIKLLSERLATFISTPRSWQPLDASDADKELAVNLVAQGVYRDLHQLIANRVSRDRLEKWGEAFALRGPGSTFERAQGIRTIYEHAAPIPQEKPERIATEFLDQIRDLFAEAAGRAGAVMTH